MARPKKQLNRKEDILKAAQVLFSQKGYDKTTIDEIAKHIGIGKGTVYLEFKNKEEILTALVENFAYNLYVELELAVKNAIPPYLNLFKSAAVNHIESVYDMVTSQKLTHISLMHTSFQMKKKLEPIINQIDANLATLLEMAANNNEIKPYKDYRYLFTIIDTALHGFCPPYNHKYCPELNENLTVEELKQILLNDCSMIIKIILSGLKYQEI